MMNYVLESERANIRETRLVALEPLAEVRLAAGEVLLQIERYALTANTITYGVVGERLGYWQFFPTEPPFGRIPAWGIARVVRGEVDGLTEGDRIYGYFPMSDRLVVTPVDVTSTGFVDGATHRAGLPPIYNRYLRVNLQNGFAQDGDDFQIVLRPLFLTSFSIDTFLESNEYFGAQQVIIVSASSKTALSLAFCMRNNTRPVKSIALTSAANCGFVESTSLYDRVVSYDEIDALAADIPTVVVDMAGNAALTSSLRRHFSGALRYYCSVGITHWDAGTSQPDEAFSGAEPIMYFAPTEIDRLIERWGAGAFARRSAEAFGGVCEAAADWLSFEHLTADQRLPGYYLEVAKGLAPTVARVIVNGSV